MDKKKLIIWVYVAVTIITTYNCLATENQLEQGQEIRRHLEHKDGQVNGIERCISQRCREIEYSYMKRNLESQLRAASEIRLLEVAETEIRLFKVETSNPGWTENPHWTDITEWIDFVDKVMQINGIKREPFDLSKVTPETPFEQLAIALSLIAKRKNDILSRSKMETLNLEYQKKCALTAELAELEKPFREKAPTPKSKATHGLVVGIVYSPEKSSAVIDNKIVHEGNNIHGVSVFKIYEDKIVFEKNGNKWEQAVGQTPDASWK